MERTNDLDATRIVSHLDSGKPLQLDCGGRYRLHIDRPVPFLCVYRRPEQDEGHVGLNRLTLSLPAAFVVLSRPETAWREFVERYAKAMEARFGSFLIVELWELDADRAKPRAGETLAPPRFKILTEQSSVPGVETLRRELECLEIEGQTTFDVRHELPDRRADGRFFSDAKRRSGLWIALGVAPIYRHPGSGHLYPCVLASMEGALKDVLLRTLHAFCRSNTSLDPPHFHALGRRTLVDAVRVADRHLQRVADSFSFLLMVTPENSAEAWSAFQEVAYQRMPKFHYRPLEVDPEILKRTLYDVDIEQVEDPAIARILRKKQLELDRQITMLLERGTPNFLYGSLQIYGAVENELLRVAERILEHPGLQIESGDEPKVSSETLLQRSLAMIAEYERLDPTWKASVSIRDDIPPGMLVSTNCVFISDICQTAERRVEALLHHEISTHLLTYFNGRHQRFGQLCSGLAGYEALQEGLAVLAEYLVGGLGGPRLRLLAGRVMACRSLLDGAEFVDVFRQLTNQYAFTPRTAFDVTNRVFRSGGFTKDAIYLRGFRQLCAYLNSGGSLAPLFVGKVSLEQIADIEELMHRQIVTDPVVMPIFLDEPEAKARLVRLREGLDWEDVFREAV